MADEAGLLLASESGNAASMKQLPPIDRALEREGLFALEQVDTNHFRAAPIPSRLLRLYGGQVVAQALAAAQITVEADRMAHSCHAYFIRSGRIDRPLDFHVTRDSDGRSFSARRVQVDQDGETILTLAASMHVAEEAPRHQHPMPDVPLPDALPTMESILHSQASTVPDRLKPFWLRDHMVEWRPVEPLHFHSSEPGPSVRHFWLKLKERWEAPPAQHQWLFAYASDLHLLHTGLIPLGVGVSEPNLQTASIDHSIWFHDSFRCDEWLLYALDTPAAAHSLTLGTGTVFTADGRLVANTAQQGLIRLLDRPRTGRL